MIKYGKIASAVLIVMFTIIHVLSVECLYYGGIVKIYLIIKSIIKP